MTQNTTLTLVDGVRVIVPDSLNLITTYVIQEQGDWFEDEIKFLRELLSPGQNIIDIGANYGLYTLSMAKLVGPTGCVWAFEPASTTAKLLAMSMAENNFKQIVLEIKALSNKKGYAQLALNDQSELNELVRHDTFAGETEKVPLTTLDERLDHYSWTNIDFIKLDAEGEESNIIDGGKLFFATLSPLVQFEVKAGKDLHLDLVNTFSKIGYRSYRLVPGLNILTPFNENEDTDGFLLNLFCCKPDRASQLIASGFLVDESNLAIIENQMHNLDETPYIKLSDQIFKKLENTTYAKECSEAWKNSLVNENYTQTLTALLQYIRSTDTSLNAAERYASLKDSFLILKSICSSQPAYLRLSSLARVALDYGARSVAVNALGQLCNSLFQHKQLDFSEPFLTPSKRFESISPRGSIPNWIAAAAAEEFERKGAFSSFFSSEDSKLRLKIIHELNYESDEMNRRQDLISKRFSTK